jgi:hypothetical protein
VPCVPITPSTGRSPSPANRHKPDRGWTPKAYKEREIPIPSKLVMKLKSWKVKSDILSDRYILKICLLQCLLHAVFVGHIVLIDLKPILVRAPSWRNRKTQQQRKAARHCAPSGLPLGAINR